MPDSLLEQRKDDLIQAMTEEFARGAMEMPAFELAVTRVNACADLGALAAEAAALGIVPEASVAIRRESAPAKDEAIEIACVSGSVRKVGSWVKSRLYKLSLKSSSVLLDLREYEGARGFRLLVTIEARSSSVRLIVPRGFEVEERFSERVSSSVRNKPKGLPEGDNLVLLVGALRSSVVKVKYR